MSLTPEEFKERRLRLGWTPEQLAMVLDTTPRAVRNWEQTEGPDMRKPNPIACRVLLWMIGERPPWT